MKTRTVTVGALLNELEKQEQRVRQLYALKNCLQDNGDVANAVEDYLEADLSEGENTVAAVSVIHAMAYEQARYLREFINGIEVNEPAWVLNGSLPQPEEKREKAKEPAEWVF